MMHLRIQLVFLVLVVAVVELLILPVLDLFLMVMSLIFMEELETLMKYNLVAILEF